MLRFSTISRKVTCFNILQLVVLHVREGDGGSLLVYRPIHVASRWEERDRSGWEAG